MNTNVKILLVLLLFLLIGCATKLRIAVERYDLGEESSAARQSYRRIHPPILTLADQKRRLTDFKDSLARYKGFLKEYNSLVQSLFDPPFDKKDADIDREFRTLEEEIQREIGRLEVLVQSFGPTRIAGPVDPVIIGLWQTLDLRLEAIHVEIRPERLEVVLRQLEELAGPALRELVDKTKQRLESVKRDTTAEDDRKRIQMIIDAIERPGEAVKKSFDEAKKAADRVESQALAMQRVTGDLVARPHEVFQDMADPFLAYIATHPENWRKFDNEVNVSGGGDTEFILVFENTLDGRLKLVTVDPSKVVKARLRISRKIAGAVIGVVGIVAKAYGVPIPPGLPGFEERNGHVDTIDYSKMTGEESLTRKRNEVKKAALESLRNFAAAQIGDLDDSNADQVRQQLLRRLSGLELLWNK